MKHLVFTEPIHKVQHEGLQGIFKHNGKEYYASISQFEPNTTIIGCIERPTNGDSPKAYQVFTKKHRRTSVDILIQDVKTYIKTLDT